HQLDHFHHFALRPPLLTADRVGVDVHGDVAVGVAHQRLHRLHILIILSKKRGKCVTEYVPTDVLGDLCSFRRRSDVVPLDSFGPKWLTTFHTPAGENPILVSRVRRFGTPSQQISNHFVVQRHDLFALVGDLCSFRRRSDVVPLDSFGPKWLTTFHTPAGENPILVSRVRRFGTPSQQISNHFVVQRHDLFALVCVYRPLGLLPNRLSVVRRLFSV